MSSRSVSTYVIAYDVCDDARRECVRRAIMNYGRRVQYSVYSVCLTPPDFSQLHRDIEVAINHSYDHVMFIRTGSDAESRSRIVEIGTPADDVHEPAVWVV